jgi:hypothetical protein
MALAAEAGDYFAIAASHQKRSTALGIKCPARFP